MNKEIYKLKSIIVIIIAIAFFATVLFLFSVKEQNSIGFETPLVQYGELDSGEKFTQLAVHREKGSNTSEVLYYIKTLGSGEIMVADFNNEIYNDIGLTDINGSCPVMSIQKGESCTFKVAIKTNPNQLPNEDINLHTFGIKVKRGGVN